MVVFRLDRDDEPLATLHLELVTGREVVRDVRVRVDEGLALEAEGLADDADGRMIFLHGGPPCPTRAAEETGETGLMGLVLDPEGRLLLIAYELGARSVDTSAGWAARAESRDRLRTMDQRIAAMQGKLDIQTVELERLRDLVTRSGVRWGLDVEHHDIGPQVDRFGYRLAPRTRFTAHDPPRLSLQHSPHALPHDLLLDALPPARRMAAPWATIVPRLAAFYEDLLGWDRVDDSPGWVRLRSPAGGVGLSFHHDEHSWANYGHDARPPGSPIQRAGTPQTRSTSRSTDTTRPASTASAASTPMFTNSQNVTDLTFTPDSRAARGLPPIA